MPYRDGNLRNNFFDCVDHLIETQPDFLSITYGAGGNDRSTSLDITAKIVKDTPILPLAHFTCIDTPKNMVEEIAHDFLQVGVRMFLALRGDPPQYTNYNLPENNNDTSQFVHDTAQLTHLLRQVDKRQQRQSSQNAFKGLVRPLIIAVAAFPDGNPHLHTNQSQEIDRLLEKQDAGADFAITQLYYDARVFDKFMAQARRAGVTIPIIAGLLPSTSIQRMKKAEQLIGIPPDPQLMQQLEVASTPEHQQDIAVNYWTKLGKSAITSGSPGIHLFTFNNWKLPVAIANNI